MKCSVYCCILMLSNHSDTVRKGTPSEPLVLGSRMDTLGWKPTDEGLLDATPSTYPSISGTAHSWLRLSGLLRATEEGRQEDL